MNPYCTVTPGRSQDINTILGPLKSSEKYKLRSRSETQYYMAKPLYHNNEGRQSNTKHRRHLLVG